MLTTPGFFDVFDIGPCHEVLFASSSHCELPALQSAVGNRELRDLIGAYLQRYPSGGDAGYDKGLQDGWSEAVRASGGHASVPMAQSGTSGPEYRKGHLQGYKDATEEKMRSERGGGSGGVKVLKKGDAGHGGGKKKRRRY